jgi:hypothetical protein
MLPVPTKKFIPKAYRDNDQVEMYSLTNKMDEYMNLIFSEVSTFRRVLDPEKCLSKFLDVFGKYLSAGIFSYDSDKTKRQKIYYAVKNQRNRGLWDESAKIGIDLITGYSAVILDPRTENDWIETGDGVVEVGYDHWAIEESNDPLYLSLLEIGSLLELEVAGNIYIDCHPTIHVSTLTSDQIQRIEDFLLAEITPAYFIVHFGYIDTNGRYQDYGVLQ